MSPQPLTHRPGLQHILRPGHKILEQHSKATAARDNARRHIESSTDQGAQHRSCRHANKAQSSEKRASRRPASQAGRCDAMIRVNALLGRKRGRGGDGRVGTRSAGGERLVEWTSCANTRPGVLKQPEVIPRRCSRRDAFHRHCLAPLSPLFSSLLLSSLLLSPSSSLYPVTAAAAHTRTVPPGFEERRGVDQLPRASRGCCVPPALPALYLVPAQPESVSAAFHCSIAVGVGTRWGALRSLPVVLPV